MPGGVTPARAMWTLPVAFLSCGVIGRLGPSVRQFRTATLLGDRRGVPFSRIGILRKFHMFFFAFLRIFSNFFSHLFASFRMLFGSARSLRTLADLLRMAGSLSSWGSRGAASSRKAMDG